MSKRSLPIGSVRKWKSGFYIKNKTGNWSMLKEIVNGKLSSTDVHPNSHEGRAMHSGARMLARFMTNRGPFNRSIADKFLEEHFSHHEYKKFKSWKKHTIDSVEKYYKHSHALYSGNHVQHETKAFEQIKKWQDSLKKETALLTTDKERDAWVAKQFRSAKKPIDDLIYASREILGDKPMSMVQSSGFTGLCRAIIMKAYEHGPSQFDKETIGKFRKSFNTFFEKATTGKMKLVPLSMALTKHHSDKPLYKQHPKWFMYCCTRQAGKNNGMVDLNGIESYMVNAMKKYKTKNPPKVDYDAIDDTMRAQIRLGMLNPAKAKNMTTPYIDREQAKNMKRVFMKLKKGVRSPSKHIPLHRLQQIKVDHNIGAGGKEYSEEELNHEIGNRMNSKIEGYKKYIVSSKLKRKKKETPWL
jgi:hypothetical protein